jgi:hypothetical protein
MAVTGQGFAAGAPISIESTSPLGAATADGAGAFQFTTPAPVLPFSTPGVQTFTLTAGDGTNSAQTTVRVTTFAGDHVPSLPPRPGTRVRWRVSGFAPGARVYAHYVHGGREVRRVSFGRMPSPCGVLAKRVPMLPVANPATGRWRIQIDTRRRYGSDTPIRLVETGVVSRRVARR